MHPGSPAKQPEAFVSLTSQRHRKQLRRHGAARRQSSGMNYGGQAGRNREESRGQGLITISIRQASIRALQLSGSVSREAWRSERDTCRAGRSWKRTHHLRNRAMGTYGSIDQPTPSEAVSLITKHGASSCNRRGHDDNNTSSSEGGDHPWRLFMFVQNPQTLAL